jgi:hypothetical protein
MRMPLERRLFNGVSVDPHTRCWNWKGAISRSDGRGKMTVRGKTLSTHRVAFEIYKDDIPAGKFVCHHCDNPLCCNPAHLFLGSHADNMNDMVSKGRSLWADRRRKFHAQSVVRGERHYATKLTEVAVRSIKSDNRTVTAIAKDHCISPSAVSLIKCGKRWQHVQ